MGDGVDAVSEPLKRRSVEWKQVGDSFNPQRMQIVDVDCYHCGKRTSVPGPAIIDAAEKHWRERYESLLGHMNQAIADCRSTFGDDPMSEMFVRRLIALRKKYGTSASDSDESWQ